MSKSYSKVMSLETDKEKGVKQQNIPVLDGSARNFADFQWKFIAYAQGVSAWLGEVVKQAFDDPAKAKTKFPFDIAEAMDIEDKEMPEEPDSEDTPTDSDSEESDTGSGSQQQLRQRPQTVKKSELKITEPKPANWNRLSDESKRKWKERRKKKLKRELRKASKKQHTLRTRTLTKKKKYYERMRQLQLMLAIAFSHHTVVRYLRTQTITGPIHMIEVVRERFGSISGVQKHAKAKIFEKTYPKAGQNVAMWLNDYLSLKVEVESHMAHPFEDDEMARRLLEKLSMHPAFGEQHNR